MLYFGPLAVAVGRRHLIATIHLYAERARAGLRGCSSAAMPTRLLNKFGAADVGVVSAQGPPPGRVPIGKVQPRAEGERRLRR
jgi:hypothetical protein